MGSPTSTSPPIGRSRRLRSGAETYPGCVRCGAGSCRKPRALDHVESFDDLIISGVRRIRCRRWVVGRLVLLGDAAHAMAPNVGQGANSAMVDAVALAQELDGAGGVSTALRNYQDRRLKPVAAVQAVAERLARLSGLCGRPSLLVRDAALRGSGRRPRVLERQVRRAQQEPPGQLLATAIRIGINPPQAGHP